MASPASESTSPGVPQHAEPDRVPAMAAAEERRSSSSVEKGSVAADAVGVPSSIDERALIRRIDARVLPMLFVVYVAAFLDRVNISNALTMGLPADLGLSGTQPNVVLTIFFVPYVVFEIPSNMLLKRFKPHVWLSCCILLFGVVMLGQGFVKNYGQILTTRFLLGLAEAGIFPGSFYLISFWYKRDEAQKRFTFFWCSVLVSSAFGGLLASAIANMNGVAGLTNWRWLFILEGLVTIVIALIAFFLLSDFPEDAGWLSEEERAWVIARTGREQLLGQKVGAQDLVRFFGDAKSYLGAIIYFATVVPIYSFAYFAPTIIKTLGYSVVQTQLHTVPPVAAALVLAIIIAYFSDRTQLRAPYIAFCFALTIVGLSILITTQQSFSAKYAGICLIAMGAFSAGPVVICWFVMNLHSHARRSIGTAWVIGFGNIGGIVATFAFLASDAPHYVKGYTICLAVTAVGAVAIALYALLLWQENKQLRAAPEPKEDGTEVIHNSL